MTEHRWRIELLGGLQARHGDQALAGLQKQQPVVLLAYLAFHCPAARSRDTLADLLWPEADLETGRHNLRSVLHAVRRLLEPGTRAAGGYPRSGWSTPPSAVLIADSTTVRLNPAAVTTDVTEFRAALAAAAQAQSPPGRAEALAAAVALYRGELLPGFYDSWVQAERPPLAEAYLTALGQLALEREQAGDLEGALEAARQAVSADPLREEAHYDVMRLAAAVGQPQAVLRQYQELERVLREELGETPSAEARALAEELRQSARTLVVARRRTELTRIRPGGRPEDAKGTDGGWGSSSDTVPVPAAPLSPFVSSGRPPGRIRVNSATERRAPDPHLPVQLTRFYGRQEEIARLTELLAPSVSRLVTVTGPGGSGKTRLAVAAVARTAGASLGISPVQQAVTFVALADVTEAARIPEAIADALGLERSPEVEVVEQVIGHLAAQPWLLVLDNYEHLVEAGALWVRTLLERAPTLTCLVTSRQRLGITGEQEFALLPLPTPRRSGVPAFGRSGVQGDPVRNGPAVDLAGPERPNARTPERLMQFPSVQLFVDRAKAVRSDFALTAENAAAVAELCDRLDGLPLALELAAARIAVLSPQEMLGQLAQRFAFLVTRQRDTPARHRTLLAVIESSYQLLDPELQRLFARLSVFRGGWTLEAAAAVCGELGVRCSVLGVGTDRSDRSDRSSLIPNTEHPTPTLDYLEQLRDCSLLTVEVAQGAGRYRLLETVREYAAEKLAASGELTAVRNRHRDWYLQLAEQCDAAVHTPEQTAWLTRLEPDLDNFRATLAWCFEAVDSGQWPVASAAKSKTGVPLPEPLSELTTIHQPPTTAAEAGRRLALAHFRLSKLRGYVADGLAWREGALARGGHLSPALRAAGFLRAAHLAFWRGHRDRSEPLLRSARAEQEKALVLARASGKREEVAQVVLTLADINYRLKDMDAAWRLGLEARERLEMLGNRVDLARAVDLLAGAALQRGDREAGRPLLEERLAICREWGASDHLIHALGAIGHFARDEGDYARARSFYAESLVLRQKLGYWLALAQSLEDLAVLAGRERQAQRAIRLLGAGEAFCETLGARPPVAVAADYERVVAEGRAALGDAAFAAAWAAGRAMSLDQVVDYALGGV
jgi:predicted ATPase/DNA-binding SARP family transcriptional activator